jgi:hypothetical protein
LALSAAAQAAAITLLIEPRAAGQALTSLMRLLLAGSEHQILDTKLTSLLLLLLTLLLDDVAAGEPG